MSIIIGYQGIENSNNHRAAQLLAARLPAEDAELLPLLSSAKVVEALENGSIDYGVMAVSTDVAGPVAETQRALEHACLTMLDSVDLDIHHCLFRKNSSVDNSRILAIASHPEALRESLGTVKALFPEAELIRAEDTAYAAKQLREGALPDTTAVLCSEAAGEAEHLSLIRRNVEDRHPNGTRFGLFQKKV